MHLMEKPGFLKVCNQSLCKDLMRETRVGRQIGLRTRNPKQMYASCLQKHAQELARALRMLATSVIQLQQLP